MGLFFDLDTITIRKDSEGRYCLNDLHKAAGGETKHKPFYWLASNQTQELIEEANKAEISAITSRQKAGTYAIEELVYAYAAWISPAYNLKVWKTMKEYATKGMVMKPEVAAQAINDPKVFMAKALMLAQETLDKKAEEIKESELEIENTGIPRTKAVRTLRPLLPERSAQGSDRLTTT